MSRPACVMVALGVPLLPWNAQTGTDHSVPPVLAIQHTTFN